MRRLSVFILAFLLGVGGLAGCGGGGDASPANSVLTGFDVTPDPAQVAVGSSIPLTLTGTLADGSHTLVAPASAQFQMLLGGDKARINAAGVLTGVAAGTARVRVTVSGYTRDVVVTVF